MIIEIFMYFRVLLSSKERLTVPIFAVRSNQKIPFYRSKIIIIYCPYSIKDRSITSKYMCNKFEWLKLNCPQSRQSAELFSSRRNWDSANPSPLSRQ
jgi:hypothetical protein